MTRTSRRAFILRELNAEVHATQLDGVHTATVRTKMPTQHLVRTVPADPGGEQFFAADVMCPDTGRLLHRASPKPTGPYQGTGLVRGLGGGEITPLGPVLACETGNSRDDAIETACLRAAKDAFLQVPPVHD